MRSATAAANSDAYAMSNAYAISGSTACQSQASNTGGTPDGTQSGVALEALWHALSNVRLGFRAWGRRWSCGRGVLRNSR